MKVMTLLMWNLFHSGSFKISSIVGSLIVGSHRICIEFHGFSNPSINHSLYDKCNPNQGHLSISSKFRIIGNKPNTKRTGITNSWAEKFTSKPALCYQLVDPSMTDTCHHWLPIAGLDKLYSEGSCLANDPLMVR